MGGLLLTLSRSVILLPYACHTFGSFNMSVSCNKNSTEYVVLLCFQYLMLNTKLLLLWRGNNALDIDVK